MCKIIAVAMQKGGCSKTSVSLNLGIGLAREGKKVLLIDNDAQGSLTASLGFEDPDGMTDTLASIMMNIINEEEMESGYGIIHQKENIDLIPANIELSGLEVLLANVMSRENIMKEKVEIPAVHMARYNQGLNRKKPVKDPYGWGSSTVVGILKKREYLGHTVNFKTRKHFKDKKSHYVPEGDWLIFENTQEAIIDQDTFDKVQKIRANVRRYPDGWGEVHALTGLMYCADCGAKMYVHRTSNGKRIAQYTCSAYTKVPCGTLCPTQHRVNESVILELIKEILKAIANYADEDREAFLNTIQDAQSEHMSTDVARKKSRYQAINSRLDELEKLICRIYEDNILGKLPDDRYFVLDRQYGKEREELEAERNSLKVEIDQFEKHANSAEKFAALIDKYENFDELTPTMINEFIDKILVHERDRKGSIDCRQEIEIYFSFIGRYIPPHFGEVNMTPEEEEAYRKREAKKDRLHQNYLKRKAEGEIKAYEERTKDKYDARLDKIHEMKDQIRQEDIAKGIFIPVSMMEPQIPTVATPQ